MNKKYEFIKTKYYANSWCNRIQVYYYYYNITNKKMIDLRLDNNRVSRNKTPDLYNNRVSPNKTPDLYNNRVSFNKTPDLKKDISRFFCKQFIVSIFCADFLCFFMFFYTFRNLPRAKRIFFSQALFL